MTQKKIPSKQRKIGNLVYKGEQIKIDFNDCNQDILLFCAFRYALGRQTYVVGAICDILKANWGHMSEDRRKMFKDEIREAVSKGWAGSELIDVPKWKSILALEGGDPPNVDDGYCEVCEPDCHCDGCRRVEG